MRRNSWSLALLLLVAAQAARALPQESWLVVIGNNEGAREDADLLYAERDARELGEVFRQHGPIASERITLLLGSNAATVRRTLAELNATIRARTNDGRPSALLVFYSGHADAAALHLGDSELAFDELKALVAGSPASVRLLIVDSCRSGTVTRVKGVMPAPLFDLELQESLAATGMAIITSSAAGETSQESDRLRGSFFTHQLLNALRGAADRDGDGRVTLDEAYAYAYAQTLRASGKTIALQHPTYSWDMKGRGVLVLSEPAELRGRIGRIKLSAAASYLVLEGGPQGAVTAEVTTPSEGRELALPAGAYFVEQRLPSEYREYQVGLEPGGEVDLGGLPYQQVHYDRLVRQRGGEKQYVQGPILLAGARGSVIPGEAVTPQLVLGYGLDLPSLSAALRLRGATDSGSGPSGLLPRSHQEIGAGIALQRFVDLRELSIGFGLTVEATLHRQRFDGAREDPTRTSLGAAFGGLFSLERQLPAGFALHLEGGPLSLIFRQAQLNTGAQVGSALATPLTWWAAGGIVWRL